MKTIVLRVYLGLNIKGSNFIYIFHNFISRNNVEIVQNPHDADIAIFEYDSDISEDISRNTITICMSKGKKPMVKYVNSFLSIIREMDISIKSLGSRKPKDI